MWLVKSCMLAAVTGSAVKGSKTRGSSNVELLNFRVMGLVRVSCWKRICGQGKQEAWLVISCMLAVVTGSAVKGSKTRGSSNVELLRFRVMGLVRVSCWKRICGQGKQEAWLVTSCAPACLKS